MRLHTLSRPSRHARSPLVVRPDRRPRRARIGRRARGPLASLPPRRPRASTPGSIVGLADGAGGYGDASTGPAP